MKKRVTSYAFDASAKTITAADFTSLEAILIVTNVTDNIIIYNFADSAKGGSLSGTVLTLDYNTVGMDNTDKLQTFVDDGVATQAVSAAALPLPSGAATAANQTTANTSLSSMDTKMPASPAAEHTTAGSPHAVRVSNGSGFITPTTPSDTQPISAASLPLPTGAAQDGTDGSSITPPTGGAGIRGWLSGIYNAIISTLSVGGNVASAATDSGNPVKLAGKYNSTPPTFTNGQRGDISIGSRGAVHINIIDTNGVTSSTVIGSQSDSLSNSNPGLVVYNYNSVFDGSSWERMRSASTLGDAQALSATPAFAGMYYNGANWD